MNIDYENEKRFNLLWTYRVDVHIHRKFRLDFFCGSKYAPYEPRSLHGQNIIVFGATCMKPVFKPYNYD